MGDWTILIQGHGQNGNAGDPRDADQIAKETVARLAEAGQILFVAQFIYGRPANLLARTAAADDTN